MSLKIESCHECPFANYDNERGRDYCNLSDFIDRTIELDSRKWEVLPEDKRHDQCPLNDFEITFN